MAIALVFVTLALLVIAFVAVLNTLVLYRLKTHAVPAVTPRLSVLIPARNEARVIGQTIRGLLNQRGVEFEIVVLDDDSNDNTAEIAQSAGDGDSRLRILHGKPLPAGWLGKNWACHQLAETATGDWLVFTDADVLWRPGALAALVTAAGETEADLLTVWPTQQTETWSERLVVPLMALAVMGYLPLPLVHRLRWPVFAAANGQCLMFRRDVYNRVGGHRVVRDQIVEDVALARHVKAGGFQLRMADGAGLIACRMYRGWTSVRDGFAKNILAGHGGHLWFLGLSTLFHWALFVLPWLWLLLGTGGPGWPLQPLVLIGLGVGARALTAAATRQRIADAFWMPVSVLLMTVIAGRAVWWRLRYGGPRWKDRTIAPTGSMQGA